MKRRHALLALLLGGLAVVIWQAPTAWLAPAVPAPLALRAPTGSVWAGQAVLAVDRAACPVSWRVTDIGWLRVEIALRGARPCEGEARLVARPGTLEAHDMSVSVAAADLAAALPTLKTWQPGGQLQLRADTLTLAPRTQGALQLDWQGARLVGLPGGTLGDYRAHGTLDGPGLTGSLTTLRGPLSVEGSFQLGERLRGDLLASSSDATIRAWLMTLGIPDGAGRYRLRMP